MELAIDEHFIRERHRMIYSLRYRMTGSITDTWKILNTARSTDPYRSRLTFAPSS
jgi:hypothetical protein